MLFTIEKPFSDEPELSDEQERMLENLDKLMESLKEDIRDDNIDSFSLDVENEMAKFPYIVDKYAEKGIVARNYEMKWTVDV